MNNALLRNPHRLAALAAWLIRRCGRCPGRLAMRRTRSSPRMMLPRIEHAECCEASYRLFYRAMACLKQSVRSGDAARPDG